MAGTNGEGGQGPPSLHRTYLRLGAPRGNGVHGLGISVFVGQDHLDLPLLDLLEGGQGVLILARGTEFHGPSRRNVFLQGSGGDGIPKLDGIRGSGPFQSVHEHQGGVVGVDGVGLEDNLYMAKGVLAKSNAEQVDRMVKISNELGREIATPDEARRILKLKGKDSVKL